jgi:MFS superfamily sulfate permease-like transporter
MRKLEITENKDKKKRMRYIIIGIILAALMALSSVGYSFLQKGSNNENLQKVSYNGFEFNKNGNYWIVSLNNKNFYFQNLPQDVENVTINNIEIGSFIFSQKPLYFVNYNAVAEEILFNFQDEILRYQEACLNDTSLGQCNNFPVKDCEDNIIIFDINKNETKVWKYNNCVYISGNLFKATDAFIYKNLGII